MSPSTASSPLAMAPAPESHESRLSFSSQSSNPDSSAMSFESSFRLESGYPSHDSNSEKHPKGKRKRTTTQDKAILEAAYNANPKPDKAARLDIVSRVSLNEKEVQIWFQNRRQNDRRKSRPLSPQEIAALRYGGGVQILSSDSAPMPIAASSLAVQPADAPIDDEKAPDVEKLSPSSQDATPQHSIQSSPKFSGIDPPAEMIARPSSVGSEKGTSPSSQKSDLEGYSFFRTSSVSTVYLSNRRSFDNSFSTPPSFGRAAEESYNKPESFSSSFNSAISSSPGSVLPPPSSSSSQVRLSLSLDGKAEVVSSQPSPPCPAQMQLPGDVDTLPPVRVSRTLHRSRSALPGITLPPISTLTAHLPPQLTRGRSRDVHAWESCCEADTRDELTKLAENESAGSAVAAISLLRSSSSSASLSNLIHSQNSPNVLQSNPNKRNAPQNKPSHREGTTKKAKLSRASSSVARMQTLPAVSLIDTAAAATAALDPEKKPSKGSLSVILSPGGDSDKENWSPDEDGNPHPSRRQPLPSPKPHARSPIGKNPRRVGRILGEQDATARRSLLFGSRANTAPLSKPRDALSMSIFEDKENSPKQDGEEAEKLVQGELSPSKRPDMVCVAGLLSLSQGNWR
ncbi:uncharacterized protein F4807DRAFT_429746 [Annulohypoxylon truncatum]|uniref:uncharacterized protein n=1 Tax=Annulohypoxylon truncatum TaxID=327061 RepID=UPI002007AD95|nr:uncharacterized protein F4807DRAFT_429746 [Annulohypoxylon truncatum]KAI1208856.1 hypothetical protein F4807DRAFT_429746 [Annulohypoxylon truncatum]